MKVEIHFRDSDKTGKRVGMRNLFMESCKVYKEPGDGLRLDNFAVFVQAYFNEHGKEVAKAMRENRAVTFVTK